MYSAKLVNVCWLEQEGDAVAPAYQETVYCRGNVRGIKRTARDRDDRINDNVPKLKEQCGRLTNRFHSGQIAAIL